MLFCNFLGCFLGGGSKCVGENVCGRWYLNGTCLRMVRVVLVYNSLVSDDNARK